MGRAGWLRSRCACLRISSWNCCPAWEGELVVPAKEHNSTLLSEASSVRATAMKHLARGCVFLFALMVVGTSLRTSRTAAVLWLRSSHTASSSPESRHWFQLLAEHQFSNLHQCVLQKGLCVVIECPAMGDDFHRAAECFPPREMMEVFPSELDPEIFQLPLSKRAISHVGGRVAVRRAWNALTGESAVAPLITRSEHGAPLLPPGFLGTISHKDRLAAGAVCSGDSRSEGVGIDLERATHKSWSRIGDRLLTADELNSLGQHSGLSAEGDVMLRFSFKEAIFKALHPWVQRYIEFHEAQVFPEADGTAKAVMNLKCNEAVRLSLQWQKIGEYFLTVVRAYR